MVYQLRDTESLIRESLEGLDCFAQGGNDHYRILFPLPHDRLQEVYVDASHGPSGERLLSIFSVCGPADPKHFEFALRLNDKLSYGSLSVRNVHGDAMFVMNRTFARDHVCAADIRAAMMEIARRSDRVEQQLTNADVYSGRASQFGAATNVPAIETYGILLAAGVFVVAFLLIGGHWSELRGQRGASRLMNRIITRDRVRGGG